MYIPSRLSTIQRPIARVLLVLIFGWLIIGATRSDLNIVAAQSTPIDQADELATQIFKAQAELNTLSTQISEAQATSERSLNEATSFGFSGQAIQLLASGETNQAIAVGLQAVSIAGTSLEAQAVLAEAAYAPGIRVRHDLFNTNFSAGVDASYASGVFVHGAGNQIAVRDLASGEIHNIFQLDIRAAVTTVVLSPDGRRAFLQLTSGGAEDFLIVIDIVTGTILSRLGSENGIRADFAFSPDSQHALLHIINGATQYWDIDNDQIVRTFQSVAGNSSARDIDFSPDGERVVMVISSGVGLVFDTQTGLLIDRLQSGTSLREVAFSSDGRNLAVISDTRLMIGNAETLEVGRPLLSYDSRPFYVEYSPDGQSLYGIQNSNLVHWSAITGEVLQIYAGVRGTRMAIREDSGQLVIGPQTIDNNFTFLTVIDLTDGLQLHRLDAHHTFNVAYGINPSSGQLVSTEGFGPYQVVDEFGIERMISNDGAVIRWDMTTGRQLSHRPAIYNLGSRTFLSPDTRLAATVQGFQNLVVWNTETDAIDFTLNAEMLNPHLISTVAFNPSGDTLMIGTQRGEMIAYALADGQQIFTASGHGGRIERIIYTTDGTRFVSGSTDGTIRVWNSVDGSLMRVITATDLEPALADLSRDGRLILSVENLPAHNSPSAIRVYDLATGAALHRWEIDDLNFAALHPNGQQVLIRRRSGQMLLRDIQSGRDVRRWSTAPLSGENRFIPILLNADGSRVVTQVDGNAFAIWRIDTLDQLIEWIQHNRYVPQLTCEQLNQFRAQPVCDENFAAPTYTPFPHHTPTPTANLTQTTATPTASPTRGVPTATATVDSPVNIGAATATTTPIPPLLRPTATPAS